MAIAVVIESIEVNEDTIEVTYDGGGKSIPIAGMSFEEIRERVIAEQVMQSGDDVVSLAVQRWLALSGSMEQALALRVLLVGKTITWDIPATTVVTVSDND